MDKLKQYLYQKLICEIENSEDEKLKDKIKCFKSKEEMIEYTKFFCELSFDDMKRRNSFNRWIFEHKYHVKSKRKLGSKNRVLPDKYFTTVLEQIEEDRGVKVELAIETEGIEGARGEDIVRLKLNDLDFSNHIIKFINRKKGGNTYEVPLNKDLEKKLKTFIDNNIDSIHQHKNYVFFSSNPVQKRNHLSEKFLSRVVRETMKKIGLWKVYSKSSNGRDLSLYPLHSFRGHAGNRVYENSNHDLKAVNEFLDHDPRSYENTMLYIERDSRKDLEGIV